MARARNIKPGFFTNPELAECSPHARLLFIGLWLLADREGRLEDRPKHIKVHIFPCDDVDVDSLLGELHSRNFAIRYEALGIKCIFIPGFMKHQNPHRNEVASELPQYSAEIGQLAPRTECSIQIVSTPAESISISPILNPSPEPLARDDGFEEFWSLYPSKVGKPKAHSAWRRLKLTEKVDVIAALPAWKDCRQWVRDGGQFIPHPTTFLNQRRWEDDPGQLMTPVQSAPITDMEIPM